jgi:DNA-binding transcriptional regulator GbsR (MarR family)
MPPTRSMAHFVEDFAVALADLGLPRMPARVFSLLLGSADDSLTARELAEGLQVSPAAISGAVNYLTRTHMVVRSRVPGERADRFGLGEHVWDEMLAAGAASYAPLTKLCSETLASSVDVPESARTRLTDTRDFLEFLAGELPDLARRWRQSR